MTKLIPNKRYRFTGEGIADNDSYIRIEDSEGAVFWIGPENMPDVTFDRIPDPVPTEPGSVMTVSIYGGGGPSQAILLGGGWYWLNNGNRLLGPISEYIIDSVDRIGV